MSAVEAPVLPSPLKSIRIDLVTTAVNFLNDPQVKSAPLSKRLAFLEGKGLTQEEINLAIIKSNSSKDNSNDVSATTSKSHQTTTEKSTGYGGIILTAAVVLGASSLLISNYQTIKSFAKKLFTTEDRSDDTSSAESDEIKRLEREFKQSIQDLKDLMEEKEKRLQETLQELSNK